MNSGSTLTLVEGSGLVDLGWLLRTWRVKVAGVAASDAAAALGVGRSTVANWESGLRRPNHDALAALDALYRADGALLGLAGAFGSPRGLDPRSEWWHNYSPGGGPAWAWARCEQAAAVVELQLRWGPLALRVQRRLDSRGLIVTVPASVPNPPVHARIDPPGWIDFGQGRIPRSLGVSTLGALAHVHLADPADHALWITVDRLRPVLNRDGRWVDKLKGLLGQRGDLVSDALTQSAPPTAVTDLAGHAPSGSRAPCTWSGSRYRALRQARGLSQAEAAARATALAPALGVSDDQIALLEGGGQPRVPDLPGRLDVVYRADGQSLRQAIPTLSADDGTMTISPPSWWVGPIWLTPRAEKKAVDAMPREVVLRWPPWEHRVRLQPGTTLTTRKAPDQDQPLTVDLPAGWKLSAGLGARPDAIDINHGWHAIDTTSADRIFNYYHRVYLQLFDKAQSDLLHLLRSERPSAIPHRQHDELQE